MQGSKRKPFLGNVNSRAIHAAALETQERNAASGVGVLERKTSEERDDCCVQNDAKATRGKKLQMNFMRASTIEALTSRMVD